MNIGSAMGTIEEFQEYLSSLHHMTLNSLRYFKRIGVKFDKNFETALLRLTNKCIAESYRVFLTELQASSTLPSNPDQNLLHASSGVAKRESTSKEEESPSKQPKPNDGNTSKLHDLFGTDVSESSVVLTTPPDGVAYDPQKFDLDSSIFKELPSSPKGSDFYADELKKQNEIMQDLMIKGITPTDGENLINIFLKLCQVINANVNPSNITSIARSDTKSDTIIVKFKNLNDKIRVRRLSSDQELWACDLTYIPPGGKNSKVCVGNHLTPFFYPIQQLAKKARSKGKLHSYQLCNDGLFVKKRRSSQGRMVLSEEQLHIYIDSK
ncbi:uncharacterized protein LOC116346195 [Contarinia nasturtii]|uniref:uncharacterized protein LOC116346195 n=1 Tax=Contarinia nasturtii TaxID=265458 RepID=UPI0012D3CC26|nr:uncharacterized protein LOC116346195 [Contarinia nasturtii]